MSTARPLYSLLLEKKKRAPYNFEVSEMNTFSFKFSILYGPPFAWFHFGELQKQD